MREVPWSEELPAFPTEPAGSARDESEDELCERIRADARRLGALGRAPGLIRYLESIPGLEDRPAVLDTAIVATIDLAVSRGTTRDDAIETLIREHPSLRTPILAADFLDQTLGAGALSEGTTGDGAGPDLPYELGPVMQNGRRRYELRTRIAEGASGIVYRAVDRAVSTPDGVSVVAVKCLRDMGFRLPHLFKLEAQRARRVDHSSVARVLDAGEDPRAGEYLVFEYCEGPTLEQWLTRRDSRPSAEIAVPLVLGIAGGIAAVHRAGFCHGDLHPGNVIVSREGNPRLIDFGAARSDLGSLSIGPGPMGALGFAAPELFRAARGVSGQSADAYSVAGLLFWLLTGQPPNGGTVEEAEATIGGERRVDVSLLNPLPRDLRLVLERALGPDTASRYPSIDALAEDLRRGQRSEPLTWSPGAWRHRASLAFKRARVVYALVAGITIAVGMGTVSLFSALYVSARSALTESRSQLAAQESDLGAAEARAKAAEATGQSAEMARQIFSLVQGIVSSVRSDSEATRWVPILYAVERVTTDDPSADALMRADSRRKRAELARETLAPAFKRGRIEHVTDLIFAAMLGATRIEDDDPAGAREVLALARSAAQRMLQPDDAAAVRVELLWAIATSAAADRDGSSVPGADLTEAERILTERGADFQKLAPNLQRKLPVGPPAPSSPSP